MNEDARQTLPPNRQSPPTFTWYVMWTYLGNYSSRPMPVVAPTADEAAKQVLAAFSEEFRRKGQVLVWPCPPSCVYSGLDRVR